jgi:GH24 family phage-related lysozyme (muramidase)
MSDASDHAAAARVGAPALSADELARVRDDLIGNEGWHAAAYSDSLGIPTVGVGFNLRRGDARAKIGALGLDYEKVLRCEQALSSEQIETLLAQDIRTAASAAAALVPGWPALGSARRRALTDMAFNLGAAGLARFSRFLAAVNDGNWEIAEAEITSSLYFRQVGSRAQRNAAAIRQGDTATS